MTNNNNVSINNNLNQFSDPCTSPQSRLAQQHQQQQQQPHLQEEVCMRGQCCCCCAAAALVTSQLEDERAPVAADRRRQQRRPGTSSDVETSTQSGFESGNERSHCCSASKLSTSSQQQQRQEQCDESSPQRYCNDSSFGSEDVGSKPCQELSRGRNVRLCSQGNCVESEEHEEHAVVLSDQCFQEENESEDCVEVQQQFGGPQHCENVEKMRLVKKCSLGDEGERSFPSAGAFEAGPRWSGLTGVPGLGASIHQVIRMKTQAVLSMIFYLLYV